MGAAMNSLKLCFSAFLNCLNCRGCDAGPEAVRISQIQITEQNERIGALRDQRWAETKIVPHGVRNEPVLYSRNRLPSGNKLEKQLHKALNDREGNKKPINIPFEVEIPKELTQKWCYAHLADGAASHDGARMTQEDRFSLKQEVVFKFRGENERASLFSVYDGHNDEGKAGEYLIRYLGRTVSDILTRLLRDSYSVSDEVIANAFTQAFDILSKSYREDGGEYGTTAACAFVYKKKIYFPNVGDSRIVLVKKQATHQLTLDASVANPDFQRWHKRAGNRIEKDSVAHPLFPDVPSKTARDVGMAWLCCRPKITRIYIEDEVDDLEDGKLYCKEGDYLLLATDGLWKTATVNEAGNAVRKLAQAGLSPEEIATQIADTAGTRRGSDNVAVLIVAV